MKVIIETIPHANHRYPTCGDWFTDPDGTLHIKVSEELEKENRLFAVLVAFHEWAEVEQCKVAGVTEAAVDEFDKTFEAEREQGLHGPTDEPGDDWAAPYRVQHGVASGIERLLAAVMGVDWNKYDAAVNALP